MKKNSTFLLVDDNSHTLGILTEVLVSLGFSNIKKSTSTEDALKIIKLEPIDLVFMDINMPNKNGIEMLKDIKQLNENIKIIMLTADATMENVEKSLNSGASGFVSKPFNGKKIQYALKTLNKVKKIK